VPVPGKVQGRERAQVPERRAVALVQVPVRASVRHQLQVQLPLCPWLLQELLPFL